MSQPNINCTVCGGTDFTAEAGFYFCSECNTQSQDVREEVFDEYFGNQKGTSRVLQKISDIKSAGHSTKLTSWEVLNYVLKGITDELISFGAKPELKLVILQLWASYLRRLEVAFTSVDIERKPKLGYNFKRCDAEIIYGVTPKQLKQSSWRSKSRSSSAASSDIESDVSTSGTPLSRRAILRRLAMRKKSLATAEYRQASQDTSRSLSQTLEELESSSGATSDTSNRMKITRHTRSLLNSLCSSSTDEEKSLRNRLAKKESKSMRNVTIAKIVAIVNIALALTQDDIQVSDFIRWVEEGHISLQTSRKFLPEDVKVDINIQRSMEVGHLSYKKCHHLMVGMCHELGIEKLPRANLERLAERYCLELQLPGEVVSLVKRLLILTAASNSSKTSTNCKYAEVQVVSAIIVVMKILFSLDDCTEYRLSHTALEINRVSRAEGDTPYLQQFVWSEWMQFVECRKAVVSFFHLPTRTAVYGETSSRDTQLFLQHHQQTAAKLTSKRELKKRYELDKNWVESLTQCLHKLMDDPPENDLVEFPPALTPLHSYTQILLSRFPVRVSTVSALLKQDFTSHSLEYIFDPNRTIALGLANNLQIIQQNGAAAIFKVKNINVRNSDSLSIPRWKINEVNVTVNVVENLKQAYRRDDSDSTTHEREREKFISNLKEIVSDDSSGEEEEAADEIVSPTNQNLRMPLCETDLELFNTGFQYWFCHCGFRKSEVSLDEFELFATNTFPSSFLWLLRECSRMISTPMRDLYANVVAIEKRYKYILNEANYFESIQRKRKRS